MIADRTCRVVSFLAARVESRLRLAAPTGHKAWRALVHRAFRLRGQVSLARRLFVVSVGACTFAAPRSKF